MSVCGAKTSPSPPPHPTQLPGVGPTTRPGYAPPPGSVQAAALAAAQGALSCVWGGAKRKEWDCFFCFSPSLNPPHRPLLPSRHRPLHPGRRPSTPRPGGRVPGGRATTHAAASTLRGCCCCHGCAGGAPRFLSRSDRRGRPLPPPARVHPAPPAPGRPGAPARPGGHPGAAAGGGAGGGWGECGRRGGWSLGVCRCRRAVSAASTAADGGGHAAPRHGASTTS